VLTSESGTGNRERECHPEQNEAKRRLTIRKSLSRTLMRPDVGKLTHSAGRGLS